MIKTIDDIPFPQLSLQPPVKPQNLIAKSHAQQVTQSITLYNFKYNYTAKYLYDSSNFYSYLSTLKYMSCIPLVFNAEIDQQNVTAMLWMDIDNIIIDLFKDIDDNRVHYGRIEKSIIDGYPYFTFQPFRIYDMQIQYECPFHFDGIPNNEVVNSSNNPVYTNITFEFNKYIPILYSTLSMIFYGQQLDYFDRKFPEVTTIFNNLTDQYIIKQITDNSINKLEKQFQNEKESNLKLYHFVDRMNTQQGKIIKHLKNLYEVSALIDNVKTIDKNNINKYLLIILTLMLFLSILVVMK